MSYPAWNTITFTSSIHQSLWTSQPFRSYHQSTAFWFLSLPWKN